MKYISTLTSILKKFEKIDYFRSIKEFMLINVTCFIIDYYENLTEVDQNSTTISYSIDVAMYLLYT